MKKLVLILSLLGFINLESKAQASGIDWALSVYDGINPSPASYPGGTESFSFTFIMSNSTGSYTFSNNSTNNNYATIVFSFTKLDASSIPPTGNGADLFKWVWVPNPTSFGGTWAGTSKNTTMSNFPVVYTIAWSNVPVTNSATPAESNIGVNGQFTDPTTANVAASGGSASNSNSTFTYSTSALPVSLLAFNGKLNNNSSTTLNWKVAQENNVSQYEVERSLDANNFEKVATVKASGKSNYSSYDIVDALNGNVYYRLKMVDYDGNFQYSNVISFFINGVSVEDIWPNPANDKINIKINTNEDGLVLVKLYDALGKLVFEEKENFHKGLQSFSIDGLSSLSTGFYTIKIEQGKNYIVKKLSIQ